METIDRIVAAFFGGRAVFHVLQRIFHLQWHALLVLYGLKLLHDLPITLHLLLAWCFHTEVRLPVND